ncbi:MAG: tRNA-ribosyltransferase, partial [Methanosarcina mazei]
MTQYFEVENRDGAARIGKLLLSPELRTPCALHTAALGNLENPGPVVDAGSLWTGSQEELQERIKKIREKTGKGTLVILPHQAYPPAIPAESLGKVKTFTSDGNNEIDGPAGSLLRIGGEVQKSDLYIIEGIGTLENNARRFLETLIDLKNRIPPD